MVCWLSASWTCFVHSGDLCNLGTDLQNLLLSSPAYDKSREKASLDDITVTLTDVTFSSRNSSDIIVNPWTGPRSESLICLAVLHEFNYIYLKQLRVLIPVHVGVFPGS